MRVDVVTLFPELYSGVLRHSIVDRAVQKGKLTLETHQLRDYSKNKHKTVDDKPFGGGPGMLLRAEPLFEAVEDIKRRTGSEGRVLLTSPQGTKLTQKRAERLARLPHLIIVNGYYEGVDERFVEHCADELISIGDYVLTGGDLPAMVIINAVTRLLPEVLGNPASAGSDSFSAGNAGKFKAPGYTRPEKFRGWSVPSVLLTGHHRRIEEWRAEQSVRRSRRRRRKPG